MGERSALSNKTVKEDASPMEKQRRHFARKITLLQDAGQKLKVLRLRFVFEKNEISY